jgi:hypothetical protein
MEQCAQWRDLPTVINFVGISGVQRTVSGL